MVANDAPSSMMSVKIAAIAAIVICSRHNFIICGDVLVFTISVLVVVCSSLCILHWGKMCFLSKKGVCWDGSINSPISLEFLHVDFKKALWIFQNIHDDYFHFQNNSLFLVLKNITSFQQCRFTPSFLNMLLHISSSRRKNIFTINVYILLYPNNHILSNK